MRFKTFINELYNNWNYKIPQDKESLLFDFYALSSITPSQLNNENLKMAFEEAKELITNTLVEEFKVAVFRSLSSEFRHAMNWGMMDKSALMRNLQLFSEIDPALGQKIHFRLKKLMELPKDKRYFNRETSYKFLKSLNYPPQKMADAMSEIFLDHPSFTNDPDYGGEPWSNIAKAWAKLFTVKGLDNKMVLIDHIYDLQHNNDTVFNKLEEYYKDGYRWITNALDFKRDIKNPVELYDKVSGWLKGPFAMAMKDQYKHTVQGDREGTLDVNIPDNLKKVSELLRKIPEEVKVKYGKITFNPNLKDKVNDEYSVGVIYTPIKPEQNRDWETDIEPEQYEPEQYGININGDATRGRDIPFLRVKLKDEKSIKKWVEFVKRALPKIDKEYRDY